MSSIPMNVIVVTSDEMRGDCPGFMGNPDCLTPHLDRFASRGVVFDNHFAVHGKCVPSRISMMTGRYSHTDGFRTIHQHLPSNQPDLLKMLKQQGYETAVFGHNHVWEDFWGDNTCSSGIVDYHSYTRGCFNGLLDRQWPVAGKKNDSDAQLSMKAGCQYKGCITKPISGFCDHNRAQQAVTYLSQVRDRNRPFYLQVNFAAPHPEYAVEEPWFSQYDRSAIHRWPNQLPQGAPLPLQVMREIRTGLDIDERALAEIQAVYYGMCSRVDSHIGEVLAAIDREGLWENTIVLFTTDHGDFAGQYGLTEKWDTALNECILHVPLVVWAPGLPEGARVSSLTEHVDIAPTILSLLGQSASWGVHGESLLPSIDGRAKKEAVFADGGHEEHMWGRMASEVTQKASAGSVEAKQVTYAQVPQSMARAKMVRTREWKLVVRLTGGNELYNVQSDPFEMNNLYTTGAHGDVIRDLQELLLQWCLRTDTDRPFQENIGA